MKTWLLCESCVHAEMSSTSPRISLVEECTQCAKACVAVVSRLVSEPSDLGDLVINCILHCRQCATACEEHSMEPDIQFCGDVCSECGNVLNELCSFSLN